MTEHLKKLTLVICCLVSICLLDGCTPQDYKKEADERVYNIIEKKWQDEYGSKANYKISDTEPLPDDIQIEKAVPASGILTLPQAVAIATAHNRQYQTQKEALYTAALDLRLFRHEFETQFFGGARGGYGKEGASEGIGSEADFGFQQLLASGARIGMKVSIAWFDVMTGDIRSGLASILSATVVQPLLRGSNRTVVMENLTQAERNTLYQMRTFSRFRKTFVVSIISGYYRVLELETYVKNAEDNYKALSDVYEKVEKLANAGRIPLLELDRMYQEKLQAYDILIQRQKEYKQVLDEFKLVLSLPTNEELQLDAAELDVLIKAEMTEPRFSETDVIDTALTERLDLANTADAISDAERKVFVAADGLRGEMNIFVGVDATSLTSSSRLPGLGALDDDFVTDRDRLNPMKRLRDNNPQRSFFDQSEIGLDLELPLDRVQEQNIYRKALIILSQRQRDYEEMTDWVTLEVRQAYRDLIEATQRRKVQLEALALAQKRFDNTLLLMQYGRASSRRVINAQQDLFDAQNLAYEALVNYTIATLNFYRDTGVLQVRPDGMWQADLTSKQIIDYSEEITSAELMELLD